MTSPPSKKEYIITEWQLIRTESKEVRDAVRARPHSAAGEAVGTNWYKEGLKDIQELRDAIHTHHINKTTLTTEGITALEMKLNYLIKCFKSTSTTGAAGEAEKVLDNFFGRLQNAVMGMGRIPVVTRADIDCLYREFKDELRAQQKGEQERHSKPISEKRENIIFTPIRHVDGDPP